MPSPANKRTRKSTNPVHGIDPQPAASGQGPQAFTDENSTGAPGSTSTEQLWEQSADLVHIAGRLVSRKRSAAIRAAIEEWSRTPKNERQSLTQLARELKISRQFAHRVLRKSASLDRAVTETQNALSDAIDVLEHPTEIVNRNVNRPVVDTHAQNSPKRTARETTRSENAEILRPYQFQPGVSGNPGGRPVRKPITRALWKVLSEMVAGQNADNAERVARALVKQAIKGRVDASALVMNRIEGLLPRSVTIAADYSLEIDATELPPGVTVVRERAEELPAVVDGDQTEEVPKQNT